MGYYKDYHKGSYKGSSSGFLGENFEGSEFTVMSAQTSPKTVPTARAGRGECVVARPQAAQAP